MKTIEVFQSDDGVFFTGEAECRRHERLKEIEQWYDLDNELTTCNAFSETCAVGFEELIEYFKKNSEIMYELLDIV